MEKQRSHATSSSRATVTGILALLLFICLAECATEQRINRGSKTSNLIEKVNGWRSQRGGSCLSYGHSCWGAHGKRSGKPASAPDWYLTRILRRMATNSDLNRSRLPSSKNDVIDDIFRVEVADNAPATKRLTLENEDTPIDLGSRTPEAKPMLDDELLSKMKIWQIMKDASEDN